MNLEKQKCLNLNHNKEITRVSFLENLTLEARTVCQACPNQMRSFTISEASALLPKIAHTSYRVYRSVQSIKIELKSFKQQLISVIEKNFEEIMAMIELEINDLELPMSLIDLQDRGKKFRLEDLQYLGYIFTNGYLNKRNDFSENMRSKKQKLFEDLYAAINLLKQQIEKKLPSVYKPKPVVEVQRNQIVIDQGRKLQRFQFKNYKTFDAQFDIDTVNFQLPCSKYIAVKGNNRFKLYNLQDTCLEIDENYCATHIKFGNEGNWLLVSEFVNDKNVINRYESLEEGWLKTTSLELNDKEKIKHLEISTNDINILIYYENFIQVIRKDLKMSTYRQPVLFFEEKQKIELGKFANPIYNKGFSSYLLIANDKNLQVWNFKETWALFSTITLQNHEEVQDVQFIKPSAFMLLLNCGVVQEWVLHRNNFTILSSFTFETNPTKLIYSEIQGALILSDKNMTIPYALNLKDRKLEKQQELTEGNYHISDDADTIAKTNGSQIQILKYESL